jgi:hypothetical protein
MSSLTELSVICEIAGEWKKLIVPSGLIPIRCNQSKMTETVLSKWLVIKVWDPEYRDFTLSTATHELLSSIATEQSCFVWEVLASSLERCYPTVVYLSPSRQCWDWPRPLPFTSKTKTVVTVPKNEFFQHYQRKPQWSGRSGAKIMPG